MNTEVTNIGNGMRSGKSRQMGQTALILLSKNTNKTQISCRGSISAKLEEGGIRALFTNEPACSETPKNMLKGMMRKQI